jgi:hypothetical protein
VQLVPYHLAMPIQSKVRHYTAEETDFDLLADKAYENLGKRPFRWQLEAAASHIDALRAHVKISFFIQTSDRKSSCTRSCLIRTSLYGNNKHPNPYPKYQICNDYYRLSNINPIETGFESSDK